MSTPSPTVGQALLSMLENDVLTAFGPQLIALLTVGTKPGVTPLAEAVAWGQFQLAIIGAAPNLESGLLNQINAQILAKVQAAVTKAQANVAAGQPA